MRSSKHKSTNAGNSWCFRSSSSAAVSWFGRWNRSWVCGVVMVLLVYMMVVWIRMMIQDSRAARIYYEEAKRFLFCRDVTYEVKGCSIHREYCSGKAREIPCCRTLLYMIYIEYMDYYNRTNRYPHVKHQVMEGTLLQLIRDGRLAAWEHDMDVHFFTNDETIIQEIQHYASLFSRKRGLYLDKGRYIRDHYETGYYNQKYAELLGFPYPIPVTAEYPKYTVCSIFQFIDAVDHERYSKLNALFSPYTPMLDLWFGMDDHPTTHSEPDLHWTEEEVYQRGEKSWLEYNLSLVPPYGTEKLFNGRTYLTLKVLNMSYKYLDEHKELYTWRGGPNLRPSVLNYTGFYD